MHMSARRVTHKLMVCIVLPSGRTQALHDRIDTQADSHAQAMQRCGDIPLAERQLLFKRAVMSYTEVFMQPPSLSPEC